MAMQSENVPGPHGPIKAKTRTDEGQALNVGLVWVRRTTGQTCFSRVDRSAALNTLSESSG